MKKILSLLLVALMIVGMLPMNAIHAHAATESYVKVTAAPADWSGNYLIVYEAGNVAFDGSLTNLDVANNNKTVAITDGVIAATDEMKAISFTIEKSGSDYTIKSASGYYIGQSSNANGLKSSETTTYANTISINADYSVNFVSGGAYLRYNSANDQLRFRYYKSSSYSSQKAICLYKLTEDGEEAPCTHEQATISEVAATCTADGSKTVTCDCGYTETTVIPATGHSYVDGSCSACGEPTPAAVATKITTAAEFTSGEYVMVVSSGYAMGSYDSSSSWVLPVQPIITGNDVNDAAGGIWTLTVTDSSVTIQDANGVYIAPKGGNNNGISTGEYSWDVTVNEDGTFTFAGAGEDTVYLASNTTANSGDNKFRAYKTTTVDGNATGYLAKFDLYKVIDGEGEEPACEHTNTTTTTVDATCTAAGSETVVCNDCGETVSTTELPVIDHTYVDNICSVCGAEFEGEVDTTDPTDPEETEPATSGYVLADSIAVGDTVIIVAQDALMELSSFSTTSTIYGLGTAYTDVPAGTMTWTVEEGTVAGSYAFKNGDGNYLYWKSGNSLNVSATKDAQTSWNVTFDGNNVILVNAGTVDTARHIGWNIEYTRFANYKDSTLSGSGYNTIQFYKYVSANDCEHSWGEWVETTAPTCIAKGLETATCSLCGETKTQPIAATGHSYDENGNCTVCLITPAQVVENAYALASGATLEGTYTLTGVISAVNTPYDSTYSNVTVTIDVIGVTDKPIMCYRMKGEGADQIGSGDTITVTGILKNYNGTIEFDTGCTLDSWQDTGSDFVRPETPEEIVNAAYALEAGASLEGGAYTLTGVITSVRYCYSSYYNNITVTIQIGDMTDKTIECYRLAGEGIDLICVGDTVTVTGNLNNYEGAIQFAQGSTLDSYVIKNGLENGHTVVTDEAVEATCTATGLTEGSHCSACTLVLVAQEEVAALDHDYQAIVTAPTCTEQGYSTYTCSRCGEVDEVTDYVNPTGHNYVDGTCSVCGEADPDYTGPEVDENLVFYRSNTSGGDLQLGDDIRATFMVRPLEYDDIYLEVTKDGVTTIVEKGSTSNSSVFRYAYVVPAAHMTMDINLTIWGVKDGVTYRGEELVYSVRRCAEAKLDAWINNPAAAGQCKLLMNMLYYGEKAQQQFSINLDNLATAGLAQKYLDLITTDVPSLKSYPAVNETGMTAKLNTMGFMLQEKVKLNVIFTLTTDISNAEEYTIEVKHIPSREGAEPVTYTYTSDDFTLRSSKAIQIYFDKIAPSQMRDDVEYTVYHNGEAISATYVRSMETVAEYYTANAPALSPLIYAIMNYADAAKAVFG